MGNAACGHCESGKKRCELKPVFTYRGIALPEKLRESLDAYVATGRPTGSFLRACIANNLFSSVARSDEINLPCIPAVVAYLHNECPADCWGDERMYDDWIIAKELSERTEEGV